ncbi:MAG TPA: penicillin-binding protein 2 [Candidatus Nanoperiomorbaceae bacterium]|nr:penicillin-binding protein 2 [Candidatus Nanoperiomorbaceae bacterium]HMQ96794.1 penicillin-binding protein 2 [Candidatus Nanoperiomorbaceae bacterium]HMR86199.1 penicillin-binding protein 2 [Candidatus Nanoperiomorbaceae bacterium]HMU11929.1 penicillin-binding protein 2 [Candidatus Nanoperiomorbaceae bacterium]
MTNQSEKLSRASRLTIGLFLVLAIFLVRLFYIQVINHEEFLAKANQMQISKRTINPERGQLYAKDQNGEIVPLVLNQTVYTVFADPTQVKDVKKVEKLVTDVAGDQMIEANFDKLTSTTLQYVVLARQITHSQAEKIQEADLAGVGLQSSSRRVYTEGKLANQVLGFVNADGEGQYGLEQYLNTELTGEAGLLQSVTDVRRIPLTIGVHDVSIPAKDGTDYVLTIDRSVQAQAESILQEGLNNVNSDSGSIIVMDPNNGHIVAMANYPDFDPSNYTKVTDAAAFQNHAVSYAFEPGSVMKAMTTSMSLDLGTINPDTTFTDPNCMQIDDAKICNAEGDEKFTGRTFTMTKVLQYSLNTGVMWQLQQIGGGDITKAARQTMYEYFHDKYRFGQKTGVEQPGEVGGTIFSPDNVQGNKVRYANMTFGQGVSVTMVQMAAAFSATVNGGTYYQPTLIDGTLDQDGKETANQSKVVSDNVISDSASSNIRKMMFEARRGSWPTADGGYYVGSKTGTAQIYDDATKTYSKDRTTGTTIGFGADKDGNAQYVIMVRIEYSGKQGFAGSVAANPVFTKMSNWLAQYEGITKP